MMARLNASQRGYGGAWVRARQAFLAKHPRCIRCGAPATVVHHSVPHRMPQAKTHTEKAEARRIFWSREGWEPVCKHCHDTVCQQVERSGYHTTVDGSGIPTDPAHPFNRP